MKKDLMKLLKAKLVASAEARGIATNDRMTKSEIADLIIASTTAVIPEVPTPKLKLGELCISTKELSDCSCSSVKKGVIAKIVDANMSDDGRYPYKIKYCNGSCTIWVKEGDIRPVANDELETAVRRFAGATIYNYAYID